jgi:hypothetical protein
MEHLYSVSAYPFDTDTYGGISETFRKVRDAGGDGIELLTGYFHPDASFRGFAKGVHLPYATDWYSAWVGDTAYIDIVDDENVKYRSYGRNRDEMVNTLRDAIIYASSAEPAYGVFHASNTRMDEVMGFSHRDSDEDVIRAAAGLLNRTMSLFRDGEPPFTIVLENLWWPGLTLADDSGFRMLDDELEFDDWGICLDTGHLMNHLGHCRIERESIEDVLRIVRSYPRKMKDRIDVIHLHMSLSADYRDECLKNPVEFRVTNDDEMISGAYRHVCMIDQHRPFTDRMCTEIVYLLGPKYVTHEISAPSADERIAGFAKQRSLFLTSTNKY